MASISTSKAEISYIHLETGVAPLANGSAHLNIGQNPHDGGGGTEVLAAAKLEVENVGLGHDEGVDGGRIVCTVSCSPSAYPHLSAPALDDLQHDMSTLLHQTLAHSSLHPDNLGILVGKKAWLLNLDCVVLADAGNTYDALFMAARAALWDCKVPRTRGVEYKAAAVPGAKIAESGEMDVDRDAAAQQSGFDTRSIARAVLWCITLDAIPQEEAATPLRLLLVFSFPPGSSPNLQAMRTLGSGELESDQIRDLLL
ncbi:ribosomal protein S5 domain 2-type protein, partial [Mycena epipterygia]